MKYTLLDNSVLNCFEHLKNIMFFAFQTETLYLKTPYDGLPHLPDELALVLCPNLSNTDKRIMPSKDKPSHRLFVLKTNLGFYTIIFYPFLETPLDTISIGPFRSDSISLEDFLKTLKIMPFPASFYSVIKNYYESLPSVSLQNIVATAAYIINSYLPKEEALSPIHVDFTNTHDIDSELRIIKKSVLDEYSVKESLKLFLNAMLKGDVDDAQKKLKLFLKESDLLSPEDISACRRNLQILIDYCQMALLHTHIQPVEPAKLYNSLFYKLENLHTRDALIKMPYEICYKYCMLCKNHSFPEYSKTVNEVINYIHSHLEEPLSLSLIAEHFHKNASTLSASFSQNTGISLSNYIQQVKMEKACEYFKSTKLSVSEVALAVGFQDFAYFSRIFKKHTGSAPKKYRDKQISD